MSAFLYGIGLHWKLNLRSKEILVHFYLVPLVFYLLLGGVFTSINPQAYQTLIPMMTVFGVTMGGVLGSPYPLIEFYGSEIKKAYQVGHIPLWTMVAGNYISGLLHLFLMSMIILVTGPLVFGAVIPASLPVYFAALLPLIAASLAVGTVFGLFFTSTSKMGMATQLVFLPSVMLSGIMFPVDLLPAALQYLGKLLPATWGFEAMCAAEWNGALLLPLGFILLLCAGLSVWRLRKLRFE